MKHILYKYKENSGNFPIAVLIKEQQLRKKDIETHYAEPINKLIGVDTNISAFDLVYDTPKKVSASTIDEYLEELLPVLNDIGTKLIYVCDANYFKRLTKMKKAEPYLGYVLPCTKEGYEHFQVVLGINWGALFYNPSIQDKLDLSIKTLADVFTGSYEELGKDIIKFAEYPDTVKEISDWLQKLHTYPALSADIEAWSLKFYEARLGTISFAWNQNEGIAFAVDFERNYEDALAIRLLLKGFFTEYKGKMLWHNGSYDLTVIIYELWMNGLLDQKGLLTGLDVMTKNWHDTKIITYLATNSCAGNHLGLKAQSHEYAGNYALDDIKDISLIPKKDLVRYNLIDSLCTWYVYGKHWQTMNNDNQRELYDDLFMPSLKNIIQMQLTGIPLDMEEVLKVEKILIKEKVTFYQEMLKFSVITDLVHSVRKRKCEKKNASLKTKQVTVEDFDDQFNPDSPLQLQELLYDIMGLPVIDLTDTKAPATGAETMEKLKFKVKTPEHAELLDLLIKFSKVNKIITSFIPAFKAAPKAEDGWHYLFGFFNLGGTVSGRLSSSNPNLQQIPSSKSPYSKVIKKCFRAPKGFLFVGLDFASLEDRISAVTTKDTNKLKVYTDGYDGHCLRAYAYFKDEMPDIINTVESINSIEGKYKDIRQKSKTPTFLLTYRGTYMGLMQKCGFDELTAKQIESRYHELYKESDDWVNARLEEATKVGYVTAAFGLRVRTPLLHQVVMGTKHTPYEAEAEGRTAGNALGQSWCLLNNRAAVDVAQRLEKLPELRMQIRPGAHIHDAQYYIIPDNIDVLHWLNENLVDAVKWQEHPEIAHDEVKLGGELSVFYPTWKDEIELPNGATKEEIIQICIDSQKPKEEPKK